MTLSGKTALVTGATGFLGGWLALRLAQEGMQVKALARTPEKGKRLRDHPKITIVQGDITDPARMNEVTQGADYVFHAAATLGGDLAAQRRGTVEGTRNVVKAAEAANVMRFVQVSTIATYGYDLPDVVTEDIPLDPRFDPYNISKAEAEAVVRASRIPYSIIRPGGIFGARSSLWTGTMFTVARRNPTIFIGDGSGTTPVIYIDDVVDLSVLLATHPQAAGEAFTCALDPAPTWREFLGAYSRLAGHNNWLGIPKPLAMGVAQLAALGAAPDSGRKHLPALVRFGTKRTRYSMDKARDVLAWQPRTDLVTGIGKCEGWLREKGLLK